MKLILITISMIFTLEVIALLKGYNGTLLTTIVGVMAGLVGLSMKRPKIFRENGT